MSSIRSKSPAITRRPAGTASSSSRSITLSPTGNAKRPAGSGARGVIASGSGNSGGGGKEKEKEKETSNIRVGVRCRPISAAEKKAHSPTVATCDMERHTLKITYGPAGRQNTRQYSFDRVFGMYSRQDEVFDQMIRPVVQEALEGYNCTVFAYGPTGTVRLEVGLGLALR